MPGLKYIISLLIFTTGFRTGSSQVTYRDSTVIITQSSDSFNLIMNGNLDAENTFSWDTVPNTVYIGFQPMISLSVTNKGSNIISKPRLVINNRGRWFDLTSMNNEALQDASAFTEKAKSLWSFVRDNRIHRIPVSPYGQWGDPIQLLGIYGFMQCGNASAIIATMPSNERNYFYYHINFGHASGEFKIGNDIALIDGDIETFYLKHDNITIATKNDVSFDRHLIRRGSHYGKQYAFSNFTNNLVASLYGKNINPNHSTTDVPYPAYTGHTLDFDLRPEESIQFQWGDGEFNYTNYGNDAYPSERGNGYFFYRSNFNNASLDVLTNGYTNVISDSVPPRIHADTIGQKASFVIKITSPFTIVNGLIKGWFFKNSASDSIEIFFSKDSLTWTALSTIAGTGNIYDTIPFYNIIQPLYSGAPTFFYFLRFVFNPDSAARGCGLDSLEIKTTFQVSRFFMPYLRLGNNLIEYSDQNNDSTNVHIYFKWQETAANTPPGVVPAPVFPANAGTVDSLQFTFTWQNATDPDGDSIADYEFELSDSPDMAFPLSPVFNVYTHTKPYFAYSYWQNLLDSSAKSQMVNGRPFTIMPTKDVLQKAKLQAKLNQLTQTAGPVFSVPAAGLLNAGQTYYWRVKAKDSQGAWGPWSQVWSFTPNGVMPPVNCAYLPTDSTISLTWDSNPSGTAPAYYEIHRSNEWLGFSSDSTTLMDTTTNEFYNIALQNDPRPEIFYRTIAVGVDGQKSGVSEAVQLPYPNYFGKPDTVIADSTYLLNLNLNSLWYPYYNGTLYAGIAYDTISTTFLYLPSWLSYDSSANTLGGLPDSAIMGQMCYDTSFSTIIIKFEGTPSSLVNYQTIRLKSGYANQPPVNSFPDTSLIVGTNYFEEIVTGYDSDTVFGDSLTMQFLLKPSWINETYLTSSAIKLSGTPGTSDTGDFIVILQTCDRLNACDRDTFYVLVRFPFLNILSDSVYLCWEDTIILYTANEPGYSLQWFRDSIPVNGATNDSLMITEAGIYKVRMSAGSMMTFSSLLDVIADTTQPVIQMNGDTLIVNVSGVSYQWFLNVAIITGADQNKYIVDTTGNYYVQVVLPNGCIVYSDTVFIIITSNGLPSYLKEEPFAAVFNNGNNTLSVFMNNALTGEINLKVFNVYGAKVKEVSFYKKDVFSLTALSMGGFVPGLYLVRIENETGFFHKKVMYFPR